MLCSSRAGRCGERSETHWCGNKVRKETTCGCRFDPEEILRETRRVALNWPVRCAVTGPTWSVHETSSEAVTKWWGCLYAEIIWIQRRWTLGSCSAWFFGVWPRTKWRLDQLDYLIKEWRNRFSVIYHHEPAWWRSDDACEKWKKASPKKSRRCLSD